MENVSLDDLKVTLKKLSSNSNEAIQEAISWLKSFFKIPNCLGYFLKLIQVDNDTYARHVSAAILRKAVFKKWSKTDEEVKEYIKNTSIELLLKETSIPIRNAIAEIICSIARVEDISNNWKNFWDFYFHLASSEIVEHRATAFYILNELSRDIIHYVVENNEKFINILGSGMGSNEDIRVRVQAIKSAGSIISKLDEDEEYISNFISLVAPIIETTKFCVEHFQDEAHTCLEIISTIIEETPILFEENVIPICEEVIAIGVNASIDWNIRLSALTVLETIVTHTPKWVVKHRFANTLIDICCKIGCEPDSGEIEEPEATPFGYSCILLDIISRYLNQKHTYNHFLNCLDELVKFNEHFPKRMAIGLITSITDGCSEQMKADLDKFVPFVQECLSDNRLEIRKNACILLGKLSDFLKPDILAYHDTFLPCIINALNENNDNIIKSACFALTGFVEELGEEIISPYTSQLLELLTNLLNTTKSIEVQEMLIFAIDAVSTASKDNFLPYFNVIINILRDIVTITDELRLPLRARAIDTAGNIAKTVGKEIFSQHYDYFINYAIENFSLPPTIMINGEKGSTDLRECSLDFFSSIVTSLGPHFQPYMDTVVNICIEILNDRSGEEKGKMLNDLLEDEEENEDNHGDDESDILDRMHELEMTCVDDKVSALQCLGSIAEHAKLEFLQYVERCFPVVESMAHSLFGSIRKAIAYPLEMFVHVMHHSYTPQNPNWEPGMPIEGCDLHENTQYILDQVIKLFLLRFEVDCELPIVTQYVDTLALLSKSYGLPGIHKHLDSIFQFVVEAMKEETIGQVTAINEEDNEELAQESYIFYDSMCKFIIVLSELFRNDFIPYLNMFIDNFVNLINYEGDDREYWKHLSPGTLLSILENFDLENVPSDIIQTCFDISIRGLHEEHSCRSNSVYLLGLITKSAHSIPLYERILEAILYILTTDENDNALDNACGALGRAILAAPDLIPYEQILGYWFEKLPVRVDHFEDEPIYTAIIFLLQQSLSALEPYIPNIISLFTDLIDHPEVDNDLKKKMRETLSFLWNKYQNDLNPILEQLSSSQIKNFESSRIL